MGFLDKIQQTAKDTLDKGKEKLDDVQADRAADKLLRDLGAWYYAGRTGRDNGEAAAHVERLVGELQAHEAEHGELGKEKPEPEPEVATAPAPAPAAAPTPPPPPSSPDAGVAAPPPPPPPPPPAAPTAPPAPPVTSGPPPPPPA